MFPQEKYDIMDWVSYGAQQRREGERNRLEQDVRGLYAEGIMPDVISRVTKHSIERINEILSRQPNAPALH